LESLRFIHPAGPWYQANGAHNSRFPGPAPPPDQSLLSFPDLAQKSFAAVVAILGLACASAGAGTPALVAGRLYNVNGVQIFAEISGSGAPIVFLHGGLNYFDSAFAKQLAYFSTFRTVIGIDQRGHGHSPDNDQAFSYRQMADDTAALLKMLDVGPADVVGHSDGGNVGLLLARYHPQLVRRLVISGANVRGDYDGVLAYLRFRMMSNREFAAGVSPGTRERYARVSPDGIQHWTTMLAKTQDLWGTRVVLSPADLAAIQTPVRVMAGDHDVVSLEQALEIYRGLAHAELCILPATGHATMEERPDEFNRLVREFLDAPPVATVRSGPQD
jgi:pimeloyl-ACP methyl ester carboxylesterase